MWLYRSVNRNYTDIFEWNLSTDNTKEIEFQTDSGNLKCYFNAGGGAYPAFGSYPTNAWAFFTMVFDGSNYQCYKNGVLGNSGANSGTTNANFLNVNRDTIYFGKTIFNNGPETGYIADFRMYGTALTQTQITALYGAGISNT